jgi:RNA recognition motif-containing protein
MEDLGHPQMWKPMSDMDSSEKDSVPHPHTEMGADFDISSSKEVSGLLSNSALTNVFVAGLPVDFDECRLRALFATYGEIFSCKIMVDIDSGISKGFGFVRYNTPADAAKAIDAMNGKKLNAQVPRALYVTLAQHDGTPTISECERIYVRNIPPHVTDAVLQRFFEVHGEVLECKVLRHPAPEGSNTEGPSRGVAFVHFRTVQAAQAAVNAAQGSRPFGTADKPLMARFAESHEARQLRQARLNGSPPCSIGQIQSNSLSLTAPSPSILGISQQGWQNPSQPLTPPRPPYGAFIWDDPVTGLVFSTTVLTCNSPNPAGGPPRVIHQQNPSVQLPAHLMATAPQYFTQLSFQQQQQQPPFGPTPLPVLRPSNVPFVGPFQGAGNFMHRY